MAVITAKGNTEFGYITLRIEGEEKVKSIQSSSWNAQRVIARAIRNAEGSIANNYHPESNTMLQAYAYCLHVFKEEEIQVEGDIGEMESQPGVLY